MQLKFLKTCLSFEDTGDIGNEYIYFQPKIPNQFFLLTVLLSFQLLLTEQKFAEVQLKQVLMIPESADELLDEDKKGFGIPLS